jgi:hypothetical protein
LSGPVLVRKTYTTQAISPFIAAASGQAEIPSKDRQRLEFAGPPEVAVRGIHERQRRSRRIATTAAPGTSCAWPGEGKIRIGAVTNPVKEER